MSKIIPDHNKAIALEEYYKGTNVENICETFGISIGTLHSFRKLMNGELRERVSWTKLNPRYSLDTRENVKRLYLSGESLSSISSQTGMGLATASRILKTSNVDVRSRGSSGRSWSNEELEDIFTSFTNGASRNSLAIKYGSNISTISRVLKSNKIEIGPPRIRTQEKSHNWKGGRMLNSQGYIHVGLPKDHKHSIQLRKGYVLEHRLVMANHLGYWPDRNQTIHHINGDRTDNRLENLQLRHGKHGSGIILKCRCCGSIDIEHVKI